MNFIKTHWKEILLVLFVIFSLNKCTVACNRDTKINKQQTELVQKDSIINKLRADSTIMATRYFDATTSIDAYKGIATGNQRDLITQIETITAEKNNLQNQVNNLTNEVTRLKRENTNLKKQINESKQ